MARPIAAASDSGYKVPMSAAYKLKRTGSIVVALLSMQFTTPCLARGTKIMGVPVSRGGLAEKPNGRAGPTEKANVATRR